MSKAYLTKEETMTEPRCGSRYAVTSNAAGRDSAVCEKPAGHGGAYRDERHRKRLHTGAVDGIRYVWKDGDE